jgi:hypothetical protein
MVNRHEIVWLAVLDELFHDTYNMEDEMRPIAADYTLEPGHILNQKDLQQ